MKRPEGFDTTPAEPAGVKKKSARQARSDIPAAVPRQPDRPVRPVRPSDPAPRITPTTPVNVATPPVADRELKRASRVRRRYERSEARRFTRHSRRRRITALVSLASFILLILCVTGAVFSPLLALRTIRIEGASRVSAASIRSAVSSQIGTPLALIDNGSLGKELSQFPAIRSFVTEIIPPNTLVIRIAERAPIASLATSSGFAVIDPAGVVLSSGDVRAAGLPLIELGAEKKGSPAFTSAVGVLLALPPALLSQVDTVSAQTADDVTLALTGGKAVVWGSSEQSALKARVLSALVAAGPSAAAVKYDVSAPMHPVFALK